MARLWGHRSVTCLSQANPQHSPSPSLGCDHSGQSSYSVRALYTSYNVTTHMQRALASSTHGLVRVAALLGNGPCSICDPQRKHIKTGASPYLTLNHAPDATLSDPCLSRLPNTLTLILTLTPGKLRGYCTGRQNTGTAQCTAYVTQSPSDATCCKKRDPERKSFPWHHHSPTLPNKGTGVRHPNIRHTARHLGCDRGAEYPR
jgi:hypothetical protein